jgi:hypothetical protein
MNEGAPEMDLYKEFSTHYLPHLTNYIVGVVTDGDEKNEMGSGVLVNMGGRHFVATAAHCIRRNTRVLMSVVPLDRDQTAEARRVRIIRAGKIESEDPDLGYLEIEDPNRPEVQWGQLTDDRIVNGPVHIVGVPRVLDRIDLGRREISFGLAVFGTTLIEETDTYIKFDFPKEGAQYNPSSGEWVPGPFPDHPKGFSGGGCFGVSQAERAGMTVVQYHLLGIQFGWFRPERWVKVAPIRLWRDLLKRDGQCPDGDELATPSG